MSLGIAYDDISEWRIYARISKREGDKALDAKQIDILKKFAEENDLNLTEPVYEDNGYTGRNSNRPGYQWMLKDITDNGDEFGILATRLDRLNRCLHEAIHLMNLCWLNDLPILAIYQTCDIYIPEGKFTYQLYSLMAEKESDDISFRTKKGLDAKKS